MIRCMLILSSLILTQAANADVLCDALRFKTIQEELGIDQDSDAYLILQDYRKSKNSKRQETRDFDAELRKELEPKKTKRLQQLAFQASLHYKQFGRAMGMTNFSSEKKARIAKLVTDATTKLKRRQDEMVFELQKERLARLLSEEEVERICGSKLHFPIAELYRAEHNFYPMGVDWLRCLNAARTSLSTKLTLADKKAISTFSKGKAKQFLRNGPKMMLAARSRAHQESPLGKLKAALVACRMRDDFKSMTPEEQRASLKKVSDSFNTDMKTIQREGAKLVSEQFRKVDAEAKFIRDFIEELIEEDQLMEVKQRVVQSGMVHLASGLRPSLRQVGIDFDGDRFDQRAAIGKIESDIDLEAMRDFVRVKIYRDAIIQVVGARKLEQLTGDRHAFSGPFGSMPNMDSKLYEDASTLIARPTNPRRTP